MLKKSKNAVYLLSGHSARECVVCETELKAAADQLLFSTEDGSYGKRGLISDVLLDFLNNQLSVSSYQLSVIYTCGPRAMLKAVAEIAFQKKIACQVSMEGRMACGIGACKGCALKTKSGYKMVCKDGPVFNAEELIW
jgi:dihydroorotate dehydrogenase electron transfer subunit